MPTLIILILLHFTLFNFFFNQDLLLSCYQNVKIFFSFQFCYNYCHLSLLVPCLKSSHQTQVDIKVLPIPFTLSTTAYEFFFFFKAYIFISCLLLQYCFHAQLHFEVICILFLSCTFGNGLVNVQMTGLYTIIVFVQLINQQKKKKKIYKINLSDYVLLCSGSCQKKMLTQKGHQSICLTCCQRESAGHQSAAVAVRIQ